MSKDELISFLQDKNMPSHAGRLQQRTKRQHYSIALSRRIYLFWDKGFDAAPDIIKLCAQSWQALHPNWDVILLDQQDAEKIVSRDIFPQEMKIAHYADILRTALLKNGGGV